MTEETSNRPFTSTTLKVLACIFMAIDHIGAELFPEVKLLRIIGRLAFPIFAFFIAEGCKYTKNKMRRWATIFISGVIFEAIYVLYTKEFYGNIFLTFSLSVLLIYSLQKGKKIASQGKKVVASLGFFGVLFATYLLCLTVPVDYGFAGVITPLLVALCDSNTTKKDTDKVLFFKLVLLSIGLIFIVWKSAPGSPQIWSFLSLPLLSFYNGKQGNRKYKYGFYIFYPLHLLLIEIIDFFVRTS